jgi:pyrimidine-nucleoside phosphorylase
MDALGIGVAAMLLGAGRETKESVIDQGVGILLKKKVGDQVAAGEPLVELHVNDESRLADVQERVLAAYRIGAGPAKPHPLLYGLVTQSGTERYEGAGV